VYVRTPGAPVNTCTVVANVFTAAICTWYLSPDTTLFHVNTGVLLASRAPFAGVPRPGAGGTGGRIVIVLEALQLPQFPAASFALTCQLYVPSPIAGGVTLVALNSPDVYTGLVKSTSLSYSYWYFTAFVAAPQLKFGVPMMEAPLAGLLNTGAGGGRIVIVLEALQLPQFPAASFALTCQLYVPITMSGGVTFVTAKSPLVYTGLVKSLSLSYANWYLAAVAGALHVKFGVPTTLARSAGLLRTGAPGGVVSTVKLHTPLHGPATLFTFIALTRQ
jgi:hypothetical protein